MYLSDIFSFKRELCEAWAGHDSFKKVAVVIVIDLYWKFDFENQLIPSLTSNMDKIMSTFGVPQYSVQLIFCTSLKHGQHVLTLPRPSKKKNLNPFPTKNTFFFFF